MNLQKLKFKEPTDEKQRISLYLYSDDEQNSPYLRHFTPSPLDSLWIQFQPSHVAKWLNEFSNSFFENGFIAAPFMHLLHWGWFIGGKEIIQDAGLFALFVILMNSIWNAGTSAGCHTITGEFSTKYGTPPAACLPIWPAHSSLPFKQKMVRAFAALLSVINVGAMRMSHHFTGPATVKNSVKNHISAYGADFHDPPSMFNRLTSKIPMFAEPLQPRSSKNPQVFNGSIYELIANFFVGNKDSWILAHKLNLQLMGEFKAVCRFLETPLGEMLHEKLFNDANLGFTDEAGAIGRIHNHVVLSPYLSGKKT